MLLTLVLLCVDPCWNRCDDLAKKATAACHAKYDHDAKKLRACLAKVEFDRGACACHCPDVDGCDL